MAMQYCAGTVRRSVFQREIADSWTPIAAARAAFDPLMATAWAMEFVVMVRKHYQRYLASAIPFVLAVWEPAEIPSVT